MTPNPPQTNSNCIVCGEPVEAAMSAECNWCDSPYHLNQRSDMEAKDCGAVWIDEQFLALQFACNNCLAGGRSPAGRAKAGSATRARPVLRPRRYKRRA